MIDFNLVYFWATILLIPGIILGIIAQIRVTATYEKYNKERTARGTPANQVAQKMLTTAGYNSVKIQKISGHLTDNFNPKTDTISLSSGVYDSPTIAAVGIAAHETGHAFQHKENFGLIRLRSGLAKTISILGYFAWPLIIIGLILEIFFVATGVEFLLYLGLGIYSLNTVFCLVTLPVELDASRRAYKMLTSTGELTETEASKAKKVLRAAAWTYVTALITSALSLLRVLAIIASIRGKR